MGMEHDNAVDKVLAALRDAVPPEGMDERIAQRLEQQAKTAQDAAFRWRDLLAGSALAGAWWRGAISGAATAMLVTGLFLFAGHWMRARADRMQTPAREIANVRHVAPAVTPARESTPVSESRGKPCASPALLHIQGVVPAARVEMLRTASMEQSHAASEPGLTSQERELVRLVRTTDPKVLATLNSDTQAKVDAKEEAEFDKFFAPPPALPPADNESPTNNE